MNNICVITLGCPKNQVDSEIMMGAIENDENFQNVNTPENADIIIINTCGFINDAKEESLETILEAARYKEEKNVETLVVTGCLTQRYQEEIISEIPEIDAIMGTGNQGEIIDVLKRITSNRKVKRIGEPGFNYNYTMPRKLQKPHYAYVKIAEGCNNNCTYCTIPRIKGPLVSRPSADVYNEIKELAASGIKEIILIAQDITQYGVDIHNKSSLVPLLQKIVEIDGIEWIRLLYAYPEHISEDLIELMADENKICNYLDIPVQHASDRIRKLMNRRGSEYEIKDKISYIRNKIPNIALRTTLIVGFPGETEEDFNILRQFVREQKFSRLGVFKYSREENTPAAGFPAQVEESIKDERYNEIMKLQREISFSRNKKLIGLNLRVIIDELLKNEAIGRTRYDAPEIDNEIIVSGNNLKIGDMPLCRVTSAYEYELQGEIIDESTQ